MERSWVSMAVVALAVCLGGAARCAAETPCPWLNAATAGGVLGGDAVVTASAITARGDATCEFSVRRGAAVYTLSVAVHTMDDPAREFAEYVAQCVGTKTALRGIGNEAVECVAKSGDTQVIGRVRERAFVLTVRSGASSDEVENVAEEVAGAMF